jgi:hypothetical protein
MAKILQRFHLATSATFPKQAKLGQIVWLFLFTITLTMPVLIISAPDVQALKKDPVRRICNCGCQDKKNGKWVTGNSEISFTNPIGTKCELSNGNSHSCRTKAGGSNVPGRLSNCSIVGHTNPAGGVPEDGGTLDPGQKNPGAVLPPVLPDAAIE